MGLAKVKEKTAKIYTVGEYLKLDRANLERYQYLNLSLIHI